MKRRSKAGIGLMAVLLSLALIATSAYASTGFSGYKGSNMIEYYGDYDKDTYPCKNLNASFTTDSISVDGILEDAYFNAESSEINNFKKDKGYGLEAGAETRGELRAVWDGPVLYLGITVYDECVLTSTETDKGALSSNPAVAGTSTVTYPYASYGGFWATFAVTTTVETCDSVAIAVDYYNDKTTYELDTAGVIVIDALGQLYYYRNSNIPSLGSALGDPEHPEYMNVLKDYAAAPLYDENQKQIGYTVEVALQLENTECTNGATLGVDVKINDVNTVVTEYKDEEILNPNYVESKSEEGQTVEETAEEPKQETASEGESAKEETAGEEVEETKQENTTEAEAADGKTAEEEAIEEATEEPTEETKPETVAEEDTTDENAQGETPTEETYAETPQEETPAEAKEPQYITVKTPVTKTVKSANIFWSHNQDSLYTDFDHSYTKSVDWGNVTLTGWNETDGFAYSEWRITKILDYMNSASFAKGVYTADSQSALDAAVRKANVVVNSTTKDKEITEAVATELEKAFEGLKWGDTKYPDPSDLEKQVTLPNPYKFFNSNRVVESNSDWEERRQEILDLAQFYEYGYKPEYDSMTIKSAEAHKAGEKKYRYSSSQGKWVENGTYTSSSVSITANIVVEDRNADISFTVALPTDEQLEASGHKDKDIPIVLSFDGEIKSYLEEGIAVLPLPSVVSDTRTNDYAWNKRTGTFYTLYPYSRNGEAALKEVSNEMASAWGASAVIDALEMVNASEDESVKAAVAGLDVEKLAVTGFSINGKYAFVSAVFDDRIDVCIPGAAGATGPSPWRYVYRGQEYDLTNTLFASKDGAVSNYQVAWGTETMANSIRHNRVRETELFRHFLSAGHFYEFEEDAYGYGTRLPYDQDELVATLAPRAIIIENTVNDYNDGCTADALSAEVAKAVYTTLGYNADNLVKFNYRDAKGGDPHGSDAEQRGRSAQYLNYYFLGENMDEDTDAYLNTDPYNLLISNDCTETPYDYYWGGFNTVTGGKNGVNGTDGWYYYRFPVKQTADTGSSSSESQSSESVNNTTTNAAAPVVTTPATRRPVVATPGRNTEVITQETEETIQETVPETVSVEEEKKEEAVEEIVETETPLSDGALEATQEEVSVDDEAVPTAENAKSVNPIIYVLVLLIVAVAAAMVILGIKKQENNEE